MDAMTEAAGIPYRKGQSVYEIPERIRRHMDAIFERRAHRYHQRPVQPPSRKRASSGNEPFPASRLAALTRRTAHGNTSPPASATLSCGKPSAPIAWCVGNMSLGPLPKRVTYTELCAFSVNADKKLRSVPNFRIHGAVE